MDDELSVATAAKCLSVSTAYVRRLIRQGLLPHTRRGTRIVIPVDQFVGWMEQLGIEAVRNGDRPNVRRGASGPAFARGVQRHVWSS